MRISPAATNFSTDGNGAVSVRIDGASMIRGLEAFVGDDDLLGRSLRGGAGLPGRAPVDDATGLRVAGGTKGPVRAAVREPQRPLFDDASELAGARAAEAEMRRAPGLPPRSER